MPAQGAQRGPSSSVGGPGSSLCCPQPGQVPWVRVATVKQGPQILPSGQVALVLPALRLHRAQVAVPLVRAVVRVARSSVRVAVASSDAVLDFFAGDTENLSQTVRGAPRLGNTTMTLSSPSHGCT